MHIGKRIKELRKNQKMKLIELAAKSKVQIATLSRIEHGKMVGTLDSHILISKALGVDITELYRDLSQSSAKIDVSSKPNGNDVFVHSEQSSYEILTKNVLRKQMMPTLVKIEPKGHSNVEQHKIGSEKFIFILDGHVDVKISETVYSLKQGNTLYFDGSLKHQYVNTGAKMVRLLCIITPVEL